MLCMVLSYLGQFERWLGYFMVVNPHNYGSGVCKESVYDSYLIEGNGNGFLSFCNVPSINKLRSHLYTSCLPCAMFAYWLAYLSDALKLV